MPKTFETFKSVALAEGFDEVLERVWAPDTVLEEHTHPLAVKAKVVQGENGGDGLEGARRTEQMAGHRLRGRDDGAGLAQGGPDGQCLA